MDAIPGSCFAARLQVNCAKSFLWNKLFNGSEDNKVPKVVLDELPTYDGLDAAAPWFVMEQREEIKLFQGIIDRISLIGEGLRVLYYIDREMSEIAAASAAVLGGASTDGNAAGCPTDSEVLKSNRGRGSSRLRDLASALRARGSKRS